MQTAINPLNIPLIYEQCLEMDLIVLEELLRVCIKKRDSKLYDLSLTYCNGCLDSALLWDEIKKYNDKCNLLSYAILQKSEVIEPYTSSDL